MNPNLKQPEPKPEVIVIGESCLDYWCFGKVKRSPEANCDVLTLKGEKSISYGMAANVDANLKAFGIKTKLLTQSTQISKARYINGTGQLLRVDDGEENVKRFDVNQLSGHMHEGLKAILISDYCKGFLDSASIDQIADVAGQVPVIIDTKKPTALAHWSTRMSLIKVNATEFGNRAGKTHAPLSKLYSLDGQTIITLGAAGVAFRSRFYQAPLLKKPVVDICGAGDVFIATVTALRYVHLVEICEAIKCGMIAASASVTTPGSVVVTQRMIEEAVVNAADRWNKEWLMRTEPQAQPQ